MHQYSFFINSIKGLWCRAAANVTAGLPESNSLLLGSQLVTTRKTIAGCLFMNRNSSSGVLLYSKHAIDFHLNSSQTSVFSSLLCWLVGLLISCSLFLPLVRFPNILPSSVSLNSTSWRRTWRSHLRFCCFIVLTIQRSSMTLLRTSALLPCAADLFNPSS